ncbi:MAG: hypothetical protein ABI613_08035 [Gemmatimonadota bacterium]
MARNYLAAILVIGFALGGCKKEEPAEPPVNLAALRAKRDSVAKARALADSITAVRFTTCTDSVSGAMKRTAAGRRVLAAKRPAGVAIPEVLAACGSDPHQPALEMAAGDTTHRAVTSSAAAVDTSRKPVAAAPSVSPPAMTPQQRQVARADSIRKARELAKADSLRRTMDLARVDSIVRVKADSVRSDSLRQIRETEVLRESFAYGGASRDPFVSLIDLPTEGPEFINLQLVAVYQDLRYAGNSIAVVRDKGANKRYNVRVGDRIGRMKIAQIRQRDVVFTIEDLGFERQETLSLRKREEQSP